MEDANATLLPYILDTLSRKPELCDTFDNLHAAIDAQLKLEKDTSHVNVRKSLEEALAAGQSLGIITLSNESFGMHLNFCGKEAENEKAVTKEPKNEEGESKSDHDAPKQDPPQDDKEDITLQPEPMKKPTHGSKTVQRSRARSRKPGRSTAQSKKRARARTQNKTFTVSCRRTKARVASIKQRSRSRSMKSKRARSHTTGTSTKRRRRASKDSIGLPTARKKKPHRPRPYSKLCDRSRSKKPAHRFPSADSFAKESDGSVLSPPPKFRKHQRSARGQSCSCKRNTGRHQTKKPYDKPEENHSSETDYDPDTLADIEKRGHSHKRLKSHSRAAGRGRRWSEIYSWLF